MVKGFFFFGGELGGQFHREAAGPFDPWIYKFERDATERHWFGVRESGGKYKKVDYVPEAELKPQSARIGAVVDADQRKEIDRLIDLFKDKKTGRK